MKFKIPSSQVTPLHQLKLYHLQTLPCSWTEQLLIEPLPGGGIILGQDKHSPGPTLLGLSPASALNQRVPELTRHPILISEPVPLLFPSPTMYSFSISTCPNGLVLQMPCLPWNPPLKSMPACLQHLPSPTENRCHFPPLNLFVELCHLMTLNVLPSCLLLYSLCDLDQKSLLKALFLCL